MNLRTSEIDALKRLNELTGQLEDIVSFLREEGLIRDSDIKSLRSSSDRPKEIQAMLYSLQSKGDVQLLEYRWVKLPVETITVYIVTNKNQKHFTYGE